MVGSSHAQSTPFLESPCASIVYVSQGNIPSRKAHATQACRMASAFADVVPDVELVTQARMILNGRGVVADDVAAWYGLSPKLRVRKLPVSLKRVHDDEGFITRVSSRFTSYASLYCRFKRPGLIYTRSLPVAVRCCGMGMPTVLETHDPPEKAEALFAELALFANTSSLRGLVTVSSVLARMFASNGIPEEKILVSPDAATIEPFDRALSLSEKKRGNGPLIVGYCGHFYEGRGIDVLLAAARELPHVQWRLIGGYPKDVERYQATIDALDNVTYVGFIPNAEVPQHLVECDILCMPYQASCPIIEFISPMKMFEYMAAGRAILASDFPSMREVLVDEKNSLLCRADSVASWTDAIRRLEADVTLRTRLGEQARADVRQYTWHGRAVQILEWLNDAARSDRQAA